MWDLWIWLCVGMNLCNSVERGHKGGLTRIAGENGRICSHLSLLWPLHRSICGQWNNKIHFNVVTWYIVFFFIFSMFWLYLCIFNYISTQLWYAVNTLKGYIYIIQRTNKINDWPMTKTDVQGFLGWPLSLCHTYTYNGLYKYNGL